MNYPTIKSRSVLIVLISAMLASYGAAGDPNTRTWTDSANDVLIRRTDYGNAAPLIPGATMPDLLSVTIGPWSTATPATDPYTGTFMSASGAHLFRLDIVIKGLVNPPGLLSVPDFHFPTQFGNSPLYATFDFDVDADYNTGGLDQFVYPANYFGQAGRFGGIPQHLTDRAILRPADLVDTNVLTAPFYERSGADFELSLCGCSNITLVSQNGNMDGIMDLGETMTVRGRFFVRSSGYSGASSCFGGSSTFAYDPPVNLRFTNATQNNSNTTTISLIFPLTMHGAALMAGQPDQPMDANVGNHASVVEGLHDVIQYVNDHGVGGYTAEIAQGWAGRSAADYLNVLNWRCNALVGSAYPQSTFAADYVWTDVGFDLRFQDCNGSGTVDADDRTAVIAFIAQYDGVFGDDDDGVVNGSIQLPSFAYAYSPYDIDYDGFVDAQDIASFPNACLADWNGDAGVTSDDFFAFISDFFINNADFNGDGFTNSQDFLNFLTAFFNGC
ncbi:MAG: hypothetical protein H7210_01710 [Pyrinomonadaceae bacterium]|nr:hypothetical protein [Phycisphaerales bacterium]